MSRSYPNFGCVKTIVLPRPEEEISFSEYKETYGIDLSTLFEYTDGSIIDCIDYRGKLFLIDLGDYNTGPNLLPAISTSYGAFGNFKQLVLGTSFHYDSGSESLEPDIGIGIRRYTDGRWTVVPVEL